MAFWRTSQARLHLRGSPKTGSCCGGPAPPVEEKLTQAVEEARKGAFSLDELHELLIFCIKVTIRQIVLKCKGSASPMAIFLCGIST